MERPTVYLAGPIAGCNEAQMHQWRDRLKQGFGEEFEFLDPTDNLIRRGGSDFEVVQADAEAIKSADAVLANMWKDSIGTAMGVMHAHSVGKVVVACDPNHIGSRILAFYCDATERTPEAGLNAIRTLLRAERTISGVSKSNGAMEPFVRQKLVLSVRKACIAARQSDIVPARAITVRTLNLLVADGLEEHALEAGQIKDAVWQAIAELASDPLHKTDYDAIRRAWERHDAVKAGAETPAKRASTMAVEISETPLNVDVRSLGDHSTIWGTQGKISQGAWNIFKAMTCVTGIQRIQFGPYRNTGAPPSRPHVRLTASKTPALIDGVCYDRGKRGTLQTFQVVVSNPTLRDAILATLRSHLFIHGHIRALES